MKIAIMGAMPEEIEPILKKFGNYNLVEYANNKYYEIQYKNIDIVVAYSKIGKVFSALTASIMIEHFGCTRLLFSGVAGGISKDLKIGDLVVAKRLAQHDLDISIFGHQFGYVPEGSVFIYPDDNMIKISHEVSLEIAQDIKYGTIVSGDQFVSDEKRKAWIKGEFKADALEMEGASVGVVCNALTTPFFILRAISDTADMNADISFEEFLEKTAIISAEFILKMVDKIIDKQEEI